MRMAKLAGLALTALLLLWGLLTAVPPPVAAPHPYFAGGPAPPWVIAHRGGCHLGPENTLYQFRQAAAMGVDVLEMDVRRTADGQLVVIHDRRVDRTTDGVGAVDSLTLVHVQALDAGFRWSADGGATYPQRGKGRRIPQLDEVLAAFPDMHMIIELKTRDATAARQLGALLRRHERLERTLVASFHTAALDIFRQTCPEVATSGAAREVRSYWLLHQLRLGGLARPRFSAFQVPERFGPLSIVDRRFVVAAAARNLPVEVWTVDEEEDMERLLDLGVHGIMTDRPDRLLALLRERGDR